MSHKIARRVALFVALVSLLVVPTALAGKGGKPGGGGGGGKTGGGDFSLVLLDSTDGVAHAGQRITFDVRTSAPKPFVGLRCYQGTAWVFDAYVGYFATYLFDPWFTLDSGYWSDGVWTSCNARLFTYDNRGREQVMATMTFSVAP